MSAQSISLVPVDEGVMDALEQIKLELDRDIPIDARLAVLDLLDEPDKLVCIYADDVAAPATGELSVYLEPSDRLRMLLIALRAAKKAVHHA